VGELSHMGSRICASRVILDYRGVPEIMMRSNGQLSHRCAIPRVLCRRGRSPPAATSLALWMTIRHIFAYTQPMSFGFPILERKQFVVTCKRCRRDVPAGVKEFPFQPIVVPCPLCGELRRYLPSEMFLGQPNSLVSKQARRREI